MLIATKLSAVALLIVLVASLALAFIPHTQAAVTYTFHGPYEEGTAVLLDSNCTLVIHTTAGTNLSYSFKQASYAVSTASVPQYFEYIYNYSGSSYHRYYWLDDTEATSGGDFYVYFAESLTNIAFSVFGYSSLIENFEGGSYLTVKSGGGIPDYAIEKIAVDSLGSAVCLLKANTPYDLTVKADGDTTSYSFGDVATVATAITLTMPSAAFLGDSLLRYPYVTFYGYRDFDANSIVLYYNDTKAQTTAFEAIITDDAGTQVYSYSVAANNIALNWTLADPDTTYYATITVTHGLYGELDWGQVFYEAGGSDTGLFSLSFLGDWSFNTAYIIPALLVLFIACCFSVLNAEAGAILATIAAIVLSLLGWLPIPVGMLVSAFALSALMALVYNKRRSASY